LGFCIYFGKIFNQITENPYVGISSLLPERDFCFNVLNDTTLSGGQAGGATKHLEFPAGADQGKKAKTKCTVTAQHLNMTMFRSITMCMVI
jgi:hypothetical protein